MPTSLPHAPRVGFPRDVELRIGQGAWQQAPACEGRGDANAAVAWHRHARDLDERAERLARAGYPSPVPPLPPAGAAALNEQRLA